MDKRNGQRSNRLKSPLPVATVIPRSVSMTTLSPGSLKPRISRLETLEAKMANIEVSLSTDHHPQRRKFSPLLAESQEILPRRIHDINLANDRITKLIKEVETLRKNLDEKETFISTLAEQNHKLLQLMQNENHNPNSEVDAPSFKPATKGLSKVAELCAKQGQMVQIEQEMKNKKNIVKNLQLSMAKTEDTDLDGRIRKAELEYQLEREELNILNMQQEYAAIQTFLEEKLSELSNATDVTFFSILGADQSVTLVAVEIPYNPQSPGFVIASHPTSKGLYVQWTKDHSNLKKGDRLVEVNGHLLLGGFREDLIQVLSSASTYNPLRLVVLRANSPSRRVNTRELESLKGEIASVVNRLDIKIRENKELVISTEKMKVERDRLQSDNNRLSHRIAYLEEQISELQQGWEDVRQTLDHELPSTQQLVSHRNNSRHCSTHASSDEGSEKSRTSVTFSGTTSIAVNQTRKTNSKQVKRLKALHIGEIDTPVNTQSPTLSDRQRRVSFVHKRAASATGVERTLPSIVKSPSVGHLDHGSQYGRHILQVHVPFEKEGQAFLPLARSASANGRSVSHRELPAKLAIHLKVDKKKIALDDFESENEEWC